MKGSVITFHSTGISRNIPYMEIGCMMVKSKAIHRRYSVQTIVLITEYYVFWIKVRVNG